MKTKSYLKGLRQGVGVGKSFCIQISPPPSDAETVQEIVKLYNHMKESGCFNRNIVFRCGSETYNTVNRLKPEIENAIGKKIKVEQS